MERALTLRAASIGTLGEFLPWDTECEEYIESLRDRCREKRRTGTIHSAIAEITRLEGVRNALRDRFLPTGAGYGGRRAFVWREVETAFRNRVLTGAVINADHIEPRQFLEDAETTVLERIRGAMAEHGSVKINTAFNGEFVAGDKSAVKAITTRNSEVLPTTDLHEWYQRTVDTILATLDEFQERDSGWALSRILDLTVNVNKFNPMHAGCHIELSRKIMLKRATINVRSTDDACFAWAVVAALYPAKKHPERTIEYPHYTTVLNKCGMFPVTLCRKS